MSTTSIHSLASITSPARAATRPAIAEIAKVATYATTLAGIYLSVGFLFYYAAEEKLFTDGGTMPAASQKLFAGRSSRACPGITPPGCCSGCSRRPSRTAGG